MDKSERSVVIPSQIRFFRDRSTNNGLVFAEVLMGAGVGLPDFSSCARAFYRFLHEESSPYR